MKKYKLLILAFVMLSVPMRAQSVVEFVNMAHAYNPGLKSLSMDYEASLLKVDQVNEWPDPTVGLGLGVLPNETRLGPQRLKIGVSQMIPWKGTLDAKADVAKSMAEIQAYAKEVKEIDIEYAIRASYAMLQFLESQKGIIKQRLGILDALEDLSKSALRAGKGKLSNVLFTERKRELLEADLALITIKMEQPKIMINRWAGRPLASEIMLEQDDEVLQAKDELMEYAQSEHPQFRIFENQIAASNSKVNLTKYDRKPKIGVGLDYVLVNKRTDAEVLGNGRDALIPMGTISVPIHTGKYDAIQQEEHIRQQSIQAKAEEMTDMFNAEIAYAYATQAYANQVVEKYQSLKQITRETLKLMRTEYATEGTRFEELLRLEMELIDYDLEILKAEYEQSLATATLYKFN